MKFLLILSFLLFHAYTRRKKEKTPPKKYPQKNLYLALKDEVLINIEKEKQKEKENKKENIKLSLKLKNKSEIYEDLKPHLFKDHIILTCQGNKNQIEILEKKDFKLSSKTFKNFFL